MAEARVFADWAGLVGEDVAAHCTPVSLRDGELRVSAESTAWATQLRLLATRCWPGWSTSSGPAWSTNVRSSPVPTGPELEARRAVGARGPRAARHLRLTAASGRGY